MRAAGGDVDESTARREDRLDEGRPEVGPHPHTIQGTLRTTTQAAAPDDEAAVVARDAAELDDLLWHKSAMASFLRGESTQGGT